MGMAASQARYLALVARKSNCEYQGQQINQSRLALSNQSANLFNQMLGLSVPVPPSTSDYTKTQYSFSDGVNDYTISSWKQLSNDPDYNYVVDYYYSYDRYTGSQKQLADPQVLIGGTQGSGTSGYATLEELDAALQNVAATESEYNTAVTELEKLKSTAAKMNTYKSSLATTKNVEYSEANQTYTVYYEDEDGNEQSWSYLDGEAAAEVSSTYTSSLQALIDMGIEEGTVEDLYSKYTYCANNRSIALKSDLENLKTTTGTLSYYKTGTSGSTDQTTIIGMSNAIKEKEADVTAKRNNYNLAKQTYEQYKRPTYVGNSELTQISTTAMTDDQKAELKQIIKDMEAAGITTHLTDYFNVDTQEYTSAGIYTFKLNGQTYYTTHADLINSYENELNASNNNGIDNQVKLPYYYASNISTKVEESKKALMETDSNGRFTSVKFENDTNVYSLSMETVTDTAAYDDAMNQYYYDNDVYDKTVRDINAKTSLIQQEDQQLELRLKQLETEETALKTEIDAVQSVIKDNVEKSFKTFS